MAPKRKVETLEELLGRPWCYYCDRDFDDLKILCDHQKAKHFQCNVGSCHRRLNTVGGLRVHLQQVHKEELHEVPNAMEGRKDITQEIFGLEGVPQELIDSRTRFVTREYRKMEQEHYAATGNPLPGSGAQHQNKRPKKESSEALKARVQAAKAKRAAEKAAGATSGGPVPSNGSSSADGTPVPFLQNTPTPPVIHGYGPPPALESAPSFPPTPVNMSAAPIPVGMPNAYNQPQAMPYQYGHVAPLLPTSSSPLSMPFAMGMPPMPMPPMPSVPMGLPPHAPPPPRHHSRPPSSLNVPGLPQRPMPAGQLPSLPPVSNNSAAPGTDDALEKLFDWAQGNVARAREERRETPSAKTPEAVAPEYQHIANSSEQLLESRVLPEPTKPTSKPEPRNKWLLSNDETSWEENKAQSSTYKLKPKPSTIPTSAEVQGVTGPVDDMAGDVDMS